MEHRKLTEEARTKLRELITSPQWVEIKWFMTRMAPKVSKEGSDPIANAALTGMSAQGWKGSLERLEDISDPNYPRQLT